MAEVLGAAAGTSARMRLAGLARSAALASPGVVDLDPGVEGTFTTTGGGLSVVGVSVTAAARGGYDVGLRLVCRLEPLTPIADRVREAVSAAAAGAGITINSVTIRVADIVEGVSTNEPDTPPAPTNRES